MAERLQLQISSQINQNQRELVNPRINISHSDAENTEKNNPIANTVKQNTISLTQRLYRTIHDLNRFHYHARCEAHIESPRLILEHCPYLKVQISHPELCKVDAFLLAGLLQADVEQIARLVKDRHGATSCVFLVHNK